MISFVCCQFSFFFRIPNKVLKPEDFPANRSYRPQTGFSPRSHNPYHVSRGGMRMIGYDEFFSSVTFRRGVDENRD